MFESFYSFPIGQVRAMHFEILHFVKRKKRALEERLVLLLQREGEPVDDRAQDLQEFGNAIVGLVVDDDAIEEVLSRLPNKQPQRHDLAVDPVKDRLQIVALAWILGIEEFEEPQHERLVDVLLRNLRVDFMADNETQEELVNDL